MAYMKRLSGTDVHRQLEKGATLVAVNRRLAKYSRDRYGRKQVEAGFSAWETPDILPYTAWLERCLEESRNHCCLSGENHPPMLLGSLQERLLWETIIMESPAGETLLHFREAALTAQQAWRLCVEWRIPIGDGSLWAAIDPAAFAGWAKAFEDRCRSKNWLDRSRVADAVTKAVADGHMLMPGAVIFSGFDDFSPQARALIDALASRQVKTYAAAFPSRCGNAVRIGFPDEIHEMKAVAKWSRTRLAANPGERIGVIVNGFEQNRDAVCRIFEQILHPSAMISPEPLERPSFNISLGKPLSDYPLVKTALMIFEMVPDYPEMATVRAILLSPFIKGAKSEGFLRARIDAIVRESKQPRTTIMQLMGRMQTKNNAPAGRSGAFCPLLYQSLEAFERISLDIPEKQSPPKWCETFTRLLHAFGWPGDGPLRSHEYQALGAWQDALAAFAAAGEVMPAISFEQAVNHLRRLLGETLFQPETGDTGLQIMGLLEAAGEQFDAVWIVGLTSEAWPRPSTPNPFIPMPLQRRHDLPRATASRELAFAGNITRRLISSADAVVVSYPLASGDSPLSPSDLVAHLPEASPDRGAAHEAADYRLLLSESAVLEDLADITGPPLKSGETVAGGTGVIKSQSACPFSAFVQYRLGARPLEIPVSGLDAADRGQLVHKTMELVWRRIGDQQQLKTIQPQALADIVSDSVHTAAGVMSKARPLTFSGRFAEMEKQRLRELVLEWLEQDAARAFFEVCASEQYLRVDLGGIRLSTFADRLDRLENGGLAVIDYKTGQVSVGDWFAERIAEPQLPLYCIALDDVPAGVFFARVKKGDMRYIGIADDESVVPGVKALADTGGLNERFGSLADVVAHWRQRLSVIAGELAAGHAPVSPVSVNKSCRYCRLGLICRINELIESGLIAG